MAHHENFFSNRMLNRILRLDCLKEPSEVLMSSFGPGLRASTASLLLGLTRCNRNPVFLSWCDSFCPCTLSQTFSCDLCIPAPRPQIHCSDQCQLTNPQWCWFDHRPGRQSLDPFFLAKLLLNLSSCFPETASCCIAQAGREFSFLLSLPLKYKDYRNEPT